MLNWAEREIEIACKHEAPDHKEGGCDYGCACYESALKAYKSLMEDGHDGCSISLTKQILNRLIDRKPLTPIEDTDDIWNYQRTDEEGIAHYQCIRMSSLFKYVYPDGTVKYSDINSHTCVNIKHQTCSYHSGLVRSIYNEMFPITMPYYPPNKPDVVYCTNFLTDPKNGDFDTYAIFYVMKPDGDRVNINRYFKEGPEAWIEIDAQEYEERKVNKIK